MEIKLNDSEFKALKEAVGKRIHGEVKELSFINDFIGLGVITVSESDTPIHTYIVNVANSISEELFDILFGMTEKDTTKYVESAKDLAEEIKGVSELDVDKIVDEILDRRNINTVIDSCVTSDIDEDELEYLHDEYHARSSTDRLFIEYIIKSTAKNNINRYLDTGMFMMLRQMLDWDDIWCDFDYADASDIATVKLCERPNTGYVNHDIIIGLYYYTNGKKEEKNYIITNFSSDLNPYYNIVEFIPHVAKWALLQKWLLCNSHSDIIDIVKEIEDSGVLISRVISEQ